MKKLLSVTAKAACIFFLLFTLSNSVNAQTVSKPHYTVYNTANAEETAKYTELLANFDFDQYRFYDKRRTIHFINSNITVDLYSAKELLDIYGKQVSPFTIMDNTPKQEIGFLMYAGKVQIVNVKK
jgi:hypothetical protein